MNPGLAEAYGWAVIENGTINIRTVSDTRRAALVNWLIAEKRLMALNTATDDQIEAMWHANCDGAICTTILATRYPPPT